MQLNVVLLNSLIKAINRMCDILLTRVEFDMILLAIKSVSFEGVSALDLPHKMNRFFFALVLFCSRYITFTYPLLFCVLVFLLNLFLEVFFLLNYCLQTYSYNNFSHVCYLFLFPVL